MFNQTKQTYTYTITQSMRTFHINHHKLFQLSTVSIHIITLIYTANRNSIFKQHETVYFTTIQN